jgi:hypothetical protein
MRGFIHGVPVDKLIEYDVPVLFAVAGTETWHIPQVEDGKAHFACKHGREETAMRVAEREVFERRRNPQKCLSCQQATEQEEYSGIEIGERA